MRRGKETGPSWSTKHISFSALPTPPPQSQLSTSLCIQVTGRRSRGQHNYRRLLSRGSGRSFCHLTFIGSFQLIGSPSDGCAITLTNQSTPYLLSTTASSATTTSNLRESAEQQSSHRFRNTTYLRPVWQECDIASRPCRTTHRAPHAHSQALTDQPHETAFPRPQLYSARWR